MRWGRFLPMLLALSLNECIITAQAPKEGHPADMEEWEQCRAQCEAKTSCAPPGNPQECWARQNCYTSCGSMPSS